VSDTKSTSPGAPTLVLVPTALERDHLVHDVPGGAGLVELCGFGPVASAARTAQRIALLQPRRVVLVGIAGSYDLEAHPLGSAVSCGEVWMDGVGAGEGPDRLGPAELGFAQWPGDPLQARSPVIESLHLQRQGPRLLTVASASASGAQAADRQVRFGAKLEDMEGFAVALACRLSNTPCTILRGVSNEAGDRDTGSWDIHGALQAVAQALPSILRTSVTE
jgi:futalosine hydrolase